MTFQFDYEFIHDVYSSLNNSDFTFWGVTSLKTICGFALMCNWTYKYYKQKNLFKAGEQEKALFSQEDIVRGFLLLIAIGSYDYILESVDFVLTLIETEAIQTASTRIVYGLDQGNMQPADECDGIMCALNGIYNVIVRISSDPLWIFLKLCEGIAWFLDLVLYFVFLAERFFLLWIMKMIGALVLALSAFEKFRKWFYNWAGIYMAIWMLILPYVAINMFTNNFYMAAEQQLSDVMGGASYTMDDDGMQWLNWYPPNSTPMILILLVMVWIKFKLFRKSSDLIYKLFSPLSPGSDD